MDILNDMAIVFLDILNEIAIVIFGRSVNYLLIAFGLSGGMAKKERAWMGNIAVEYK
ncbi:hypothetical protein [Paenibacillus sp. FSL W7-1332]|uniref:hypothetical protein n=1 Tax=Paenibacillus sp. FSL W7-1332 TaxID=2921702 RepID=UPI0030CEA628